MKMIMKIITRHFIVMVKTLLFNPDLSSSHLSTKTGYFMFVVLDCAVIPPDIAGQCETESFIEAAKASIGL
jgi:hypothetical protein